MPSDFVSPKIDRIPLSNNRFIDVKRRLNAGEVRRVFARMVKTSQIGTVPTLDYEMVGLTKVVLYLVGWSCTDHEGQPVPVSEDAINNLDPALYDEILKAVTAHEEKVEKELEAEKNAQAGERESSTISSSPESLHGVTSGWVS
jgi:hypothetical protein